MQDNGASDQSAVRVELRLRVNVVRSIPTFSARTAWLSWPARSMSASNEYCVMVRSSGDNRVSQREESFLANLRTSETGAGTKLGRVQSFMNFFLY
jgi:hypothetical protein